MAYDIRTKYEENSPLHCWTKAGYIRKPGTKKGAKGSCSKQSPAQDGTKGGGTKKVCLPKAKIARMSKAERKKGINDKRAAGSKGKYKCSSKSNVTGTSSKN